MVLLILLAFVSITAVLAWYLISHDKGPKESRFVLLVDFIMGIIGAILAYSIESHFVNLNNLLAGANKGSQLSTALIISAIEESCKFIPLAIIIYRSRYFRGYSDGVIYFALAGLGFGLPENFLFTLQNGNQAGITRILFTPIFHACTTAFVGYYLAKQKFEKRSFLIVIGALLVAVVIHALYDFGLIAGSTLYKTISIAITVCLVVLLFLVYEKATVKDQKRRR